MTSAKRRAFGAALACAAALAGARGAAGGELGGGPFPSGAWAMRQGGLAQDVGPQASSGAALSLVATTRGALRATERRLLARLSSAPTAGPQRPWRADLLGDGVRGGRARLRAVAPLTAPTPGAAGLFIAAAALCAFPRRKRN